MKKLIIILLIFVASEVFAQTYYMAVKNSDGSYTNSGQGAKVSDISKVIFVDCPATVDDAEGNTYNTVVIGDGCWMATNLNVGKRIAGSFEQTSTDTDIEKYCYNDLKTNCDTYGGLYTWAEAMGYEDGASNIAINTFSDDKVQGICPTGWHIPTLVELQALSTAISNSGNALKAIGQGTESGVGTNTSGFSALLTGYRLKFDEGGIFRWLQFTTYFLSSTQDSFAFYPLALESSSGDVSFSSWLKRDAFSIRCLKD